MRHEQYNINTSTKGAWINSKCSYYIILYDIHRKVILYVRPSAKPLGTINKKLRDTWLNEKYKYYHAACFHDDPNIAESTWNNHQFVSIQDGEIIGMIDYQIDRSSEFVYGLGIINFEKNPTYTFSLDLRTALKDIFEKYAFRRIEWSVIVGNPIEKSYDKICAKYGGRIVGIHKNRIKLIVGSVITGAPGTSASVQNVGTEKDAVLNMTIPKGDTGEVENISTVQIEFEQAGTRANIQSGEMFSTILGKIAKWFADIKAAAFYTVVNGVTQTESGKAVLDAAVGKYLDEKKIDASKIVANLNITEPGFIMDGKTASEAFAELNRKSIFESEITGTTTDYGNLQLGINPAIYNVLYAKSKVGAIAIPYIVSAGTDWAVNIRTAGTFVAQANLKTTVVVGLAAK